MLVNKKRKKAKIIGKFFLELNLKDRKKKKRGDEKMITKPKRADAYFVTQQQVASAIREVERILFLEELPDPSPEKDMLDVAISNLQEAESYLMKARLRMHD